MLPFTLDELADAVKAGRVTARPHPFLPYTVYNYSAETQYSKDWDDITLNCRGLILDDKGRIIARPWKKFFNLGEVNLPVQFDTPVEIMDKVDGSLGILYPIVHPEGYDVTWAIATRGSFESEQAVHASKVWNENYSNLSPAPGYTLLFEILLPWNRIVIDYFHGENKYISQEVSERSAPNDSGEHLYSTQEGVENLPSMSKGSRESRPGEEPDAQSGERTPMEVRESGQVERTLNENVQENSREDSGSQDGEALHGLRANLPSGVHGLRPSSGDGKEVQYRSGSKSERSRRGNGEMRTGVRELSSDSDVHNTEGDLVLLGAVENETGHYLSPNSAKWQFTHNATKEVTCWPGPVVEVMPYNTLGEALGYTDRKNAEGFVIRSHNFLVKLKQPDYIELHKLVTNASPKTVWEQLRQGKSKDEIISAFPDEFHDYIGSMIDPLLEAYEERWKEISEGFFRAITSVYAPLANRRKFADSIAGKRDKGYYFAMLDDRPIKDMLWKELKPSMRNEMNG